MLGPVAAVPAPGLPPGIVSLLQDKLLPLVLRVLEAHPAGGERRGELSLGLASPSCTWDRGVQAGHGSLVEVGVLAIRKHPF